MEIKPTETNQPRPEVIQLNQRFKLFAQERSKDLKNRKGYLFFGGIVSSVFLKVENLPPLEIVIKARSFGPINNGLLPLSLAPFNPQAGYEVTKDDYDPTLRSQKLKKIREKLTVQNIELFPPLKDLWLIATFMEPEPYKPEIKEILEGMRLQLFFPNGKEFEGKPSPDPLSELEAPTLEWINLMFTNFYPLATGPFPTSKDAPHPGQPLVLPSDMNHLKVI